MRFFSPIKKFFLDFLFPRSPRVIELEALSPSELLEILPINEVEPADSVVALFDYSHSVTKEIVWEVKYNGNRVLADRLGEILYDTIISELEDKNIFEKFKTVVLMPMPMSDLRRFERGWNQAELLASAVKEKDVARRFKYLPRQLAKLRHTESQTRTANKSERRENLKDSMVVLNPGTVLDRCVVLIDDVVTTGYTFAEAKRALKEAGVKRVLCFAVAH